jgi:hypothetical protein
MTLPNVAIGGKMQVGKTTCANHLVARYGYARYALADPIKEIARREFGWDGLKDERGRRLLQEIGTVGRAYEPGLWLRRFERWSASRAEGPVVIDDVRLLEEAAYFKRSGFLTVLVLRPAPVPGAESASSLRRHETETGLEAAELDLVVANEGTIADLHQTLDGMLTRWRAHGR